jgi:multidrug efflux pump subunit AcrA (membrane-fusion protein)
LGYEEAALLVPEVAIGYDQLGSYVLVVGNDNVVERRPVKLGVRSDSLQVIREGLSGGEWVIVQGQMRAIPGRQVTPVRQPPPPEPEKTKTTTPANQAGKGAQ